MRTTSRNSLRRGSAVLLSSLLAPMGFGAASSVHAAVSDADREALLPKEVEESAERQLVDPSLSSPARTTELQSILQATRDDTSVAIELGFETLETSSSEVRATLKLAGAIDEDEDDASLASLEGFADDTTLTLGISLQTPDPERVFLSTSAQDFHRMLENAWMAMNPGKEPPDDFHLPACPAGQSAGSNEGCRQRRLIKKQLGLLGGIKFFRLEATYAAPETFEYVTETDLTERSEEHDGFAVAVSGGWLPLRRGAYYVGLSYRYEEDHRPGAKRELCTPFGDLPGVLACSEKVVGAPTETEKQIARLELRKYFRNGSLAVNPRISRDFENDVTGAELPVYLLKDGEGLLNGGLAVGWRSDTEDYTLSAFVGTMANPLK